MRNLPPVTTARQTVNNFSHRSNQLIPVDYDDLGYQKKLIKDKVYGLGSKQLDFGKYLPSPKPGHTTGRSGRGGARRGGGVGRGWVGRDVVGSIGPGDNPPFCPPANRS